MSKANNRNASCQDPHINFVLFRFQQHSSKIGKSITTHPFPSHPPDCQFENTAMEKFISGKIKSRYVLIYYNTP